MYHSLGADTLTDLVMEVELWTDTYHVCKSPEHQKVLRSRIESQIMEIRDSGAMNEAFHLTVRLNESN